MNLSYKSKANLKIIKRFHNIMDWVAGNKRLLPNDHLQAKYNRSSEALMQMGM